MGTTRRNLHAAFGLVLTYYQGKQIVRLDATRTGQKFVIEVCFEGNFSARAGGRAKEALREAVAQVVSGNQLTEFTETRKPISFTFTVSTETEVSELLYQICDAANERIPLFEATQFTYGLVCFDEESTLDTV